MADTNVGPKIKLTPDLDLGRLKIEVTNMSENKTYRITRNNTDFYEIIPEEDFTLFTLFDSIIPYGVEQTYKLYQGVSRQEDVTADLVDSDSQRLYFEDSFLIDTGHILPIKYNPQVSSFKRTIQEAKLETLGNKYPFIVRNGALDYAEFQIGGLLSATTPSVGFGVSEAAANLNPKTFKIERDFKMNVLSWLNDGQPKLFKSPTEGEFLVYLMGVSLTPWENPLGRLLHTFTANAVEIGPATIENLARNNIYNAGLLFDEENEEDEQEV